MVMGLRARIRWLAASESSRETCAAGLRQASGEARRGGMGTCRDAAAPGGAAAPIFWTV